MNLRVNLLVTRLVLYLVALVTVFGLPTSMKLFFSFAVWAVEG